MRASNVPKIGDKEEQRFLRKVDWNLFRQFHEIVQSGSLSEAARRLNTHQPRLSIALKRLEDHLGVTLCHRSARGITLTPAGKVVMQQASDAVELIRRVPHLTAQVSKQIEGTLTIWMISDIISAELDESLASVLRRHPDVELKVEIVNWRQVLDGVIAGDCDIGVTYESDSMADLRYEPMMRETQQLYCGRTHPLFGYRTRNPAALTSQRFVLSAADEPKDLERFRLHFGLGANLAAGADNLLEAARLIRLGVGIGFLPTIVAEPLADKLWPILPISLLPRYLIYMITPAVAPLSTPAQMFYDEMVRRLRAKPELS